MAVVDPITVVVDDGMIDDDEKTEDEDGGIEDDEGAGVADVLTKLEGVEMEDGLKEVGVSEIEASVSENTSEAIVDEGVNEGDVVRPGIDVMEKLDMAVARGPLLR